MGRAGVGVIRVSGPLVQTVLKQIMSKARPTLKPRFAYFSNLINPKSQHVLDEGLVLYFKGPHSYTGEDVAELQVHSNPLVLKSILNVLLELGVELAGPGDFTKRAFLNGKIDLTKAEAVIDLIDCKTQAAQHVALSQLQGQLFKHIEGLKTPLLEALEHIEGSINFPDEIDPINRTEFKTTLTHCLTDITQLINTQDYGKHISGGIKLLIVGKPNVGKSSLLNALLGEDRALVSAEAGTTRDFIDADWELGGLLFRLMDTAGLRKATDTIEHMGIQKVADLLNQTDAIVWVLDTSREFDTEDQSILNTLSALKKPIFVLANKTDCPSKMPQLPTLKTSGTLYISTQTKIGLEAFKESLVTFFSNKASNQTDIICNVRQLHCLNTASLALNDLLKALDQGLEDDMFTIDLKQVVSALSELTGDALHERVLDGIFSRFCVGK